MAEPSSPGSVLRRFVAPREFLALVTSPRHLLRTHEADAALLGLYDPLQRVCYVTSRRELEEVATLRRPA